MSNKYDWPSFAISTHLVMIFSGRTAMMESTCVTCTIKSSVEISRWLSLCSPVSVFLYLSESNSLLFIENRWHSCTLLLMWCTSNKILAAMVSATLMFLSFFLPKHTILSETSSNLTYIVSLITYPIIFKQMCLILPLNIY